MKCCQSKESNNDCGSRKYQYLATASVSFGAIAAGTVTGWSSPTLPILLSEQSPIPITQDEGSWLAVLPMMSSVLGALSGAICVDKFGRKATILSVSVPYFVSWILVAAADRIEYLFVGRFLAGLCDGLAIPTLPMYLGEISDPGVRGMLVSMVSVMVIFGILLANLVGMCCTMSQTAYIFSTLPVVMFVTFVWMPESPYYHAMKKNNEGAQSSLRKLRGKQDVSAELEVLCKAAEEEEKNRGNVLDMVRVKSNFKTLLITMGIRAIQQFSGVSAITLYTKIIFQQADGIISANSSTLILITVQLIVCALSSVIVDKTGRLPLLIASTVGCTVSLAVEGLYFYLKDVIHHAASLQWLPLPALLAYMVLYGVGLGTIPVLILGEVFPMSIKAYALCYMDVFYSVTATISTKFFQVMMDGYGIFVPFWAFAGICAAGAVFIWVAVPETKGKTLLDIQAELKGAKECGGEQTYL